MNPEDVLNDLRNEEIRGPRNVGNQAALTTANERIKELELRVNIIAYDYHLATLKHHPALENPAHDPCEALRASLRAMREEADRRSALGTIGAGIHAGYAAELRALEGE